MRSPKDWEVTAAQINRHPSNRMFLRRNLTPRGLPQPVFQRFEREEPGLGETVLMVASVLVMLYIGVSVLVRLFP